MPPTVELEEARSGAAGRQALWHAVRLTWHGQKWAGSGSRMQRGSTVGLPGVAGRSWPCPPLDLLRSPAGGVESTRFPKCVLPLSLPFFSALRDRHRTWMGTWRRSVSMCPCRCGSERARHGRMAGTRAKTRDGRRSDELLDPLPQACQVSITNQLSRYSCTSDTCLLSSLENTAVAISVSYSILLQLMLQLYAPPNTATQLYYTYSCSLSSSFIVPCPCS